VVKELGLGTVRLARPSAALMARFEDKVDALLWSGVIRQGAYGLRVRERGAGFLAAFPQHGLAHGLSRVLMPAGECEEAVQEAGPGTPQQEQAILAPQHEVYDNGKSVSLHDVSLAA
jgi:hypothetical protein